MDPIFIPNEADFKKWIRETVGECLEEYFSKNHSEDSSQEELLSRKQIAQKLKISLVTLTDWVKRGLPSHKQRGRVFFIYKEVIEFIKKNRLKDYIRKGLQE